MLSSFIVYIYAGFAFMFCLLVAHAIARDWWKQRKLERYLIKMYWEE
jgi:hypothetical protein